MNPQLPKENAIEGPNWAPKTFPGCGHLFGPPAKGVSRATRQSQITLGLGVTLGYHFEVLARDFTHFIIVYVYRCS